MKKLLLILIGLMLFIFVGCSNEKDINPYIPDLKVTYKEEDIFVTKGGYQWTTSVNLFKKQTTIADTASPDQIANSISSSKVLSEAELNLKFTYNPDKVEVISWGELKDKKYTFDNNIITAPKEEGTYIFEIVGTWKENKASYIIKIIVDDKA